MVCLTFFPSINGVYDHGRNCDSVFEVPDLDPQAIRSAQHWEAGLTFAFIPKGTGVLIVPVPKRDALRGIAKGASATDYRDRADRF